MTAATTMTAKEFCKLLDSKNLSLRDAAAIAYKDRSMIRRYRSGDIAVPAGVVALIQMAPKRTEKRPAGYAGVWIEDRPKPKKAKRKNGRRA